MPWRCWSCRLFRDSDERDDAARVALAPAMSDKEGRWRQKGNVAREALLAAFDQGCAGSFRRPANGDCFEHVVGYGCSHPLGVSSPKSLADRRNGLLPVVKL